LVEEFYSSPVNVATIVVKGKHKAFLGGVENNKVELSQEKEEG